MSFSNLCSHGVTPKITFYIPRNSTYENAYRPEEVESGEDKWIAAELLLQKVICIFAYLCEITLWEKLNIFVSVLYFFSKYLSIPWKLSSLKHRKNFSSKVNILSRDVRIFFRYLKNFVYFSLLFSPEALKLFREVPIVKHCIRRREKSHT